MAPLANSKSKARSEGLRSAELLNRREAAALAEVSLRSVNKAIEEDVLEPARHARQGKALDCWDVLALALIARVELPLAAETKRRINEWVHGFAGEDDFQAGREMLLTDVLVLRTDAEFGRLAERLYRYLDDRERYVEAKPEIQGGEPVIVGTRLPARTVAARLGAGDTIADLAAEYPEIPAAAFEAARIYAETHPRLGRPARPWRDD